MMTKNSSGFSGLVKLLLVIPAIVFLFLILSSCAARKKTALTSTTVQPADDEPFVVVEEMPQFPGGDSALLQFIADNTKYPEAAKIKGIAGKVIVRFCVNKTGGVDRVSVIRVVDPELDKEAARVVSTLPSFKPGRQGGKEVAVWYMVPINFALSDKSSMALPPPPPPPPPPVPGNSTTDISVVEETPGASSEPFVVVEEMPVFPGGNEGLMNYIAANIKYPESAKLSRLEGKVIIRFCVTETGTVDRVKVLRSVETSLDAEAARVISSLPEFRPGKQGGVPVAVWHMIPVEFKLN
jgi:TonB family protein